MGGALWCGMMVEREICSTSWRGWWRDVGGGVRSGGRGCCCSCRRWQEHWGLGQCSGRGGRGGSGRLCRIRKERSWEGEMVALINPRAMSSATLLLGHPTPRFISPAQDYITSSLIHH